MQTPATRCTVAINDIDVPAGRRRLDRNIIECIAESIKTLGLLNPIVLRASSKQSGEDAGKPFILVAGHHRLEALKLLGREEAECLLLADDDLQAELAEIDENFCRAELTPAQMASAMARRKEIYLALYPETAPGKAQARGLNTKIGRGDVADNLSPTFAVATAAKSGKNRRFVERAAARGEAITPQKLDKIAGTSLDKAVELDALAKMPAEKRDELIDAATRGERVSARAPVAPETSPKPLPDPSDYDAQLVRLEASWDAACDSVRVTFGFEVLGLGDAAYSLPKQETQQDGHAEKHVPGAALA
jgi:ParB family transcriptional regulator, chromosome partitioning protein